MDLWYMKTKTIGSPAEERDYLLLKINTATLENTWPFTGHVFTTLYTYIALQAP